MGVTRAKASILMIAAFVLVGAIASPSGEPESLVTPPVKDQAEPIFHFDQTDRSAPGDYFVTEVDGSHQVVGFRFTNFGGNRVLPKAQKEIGNGPSRQFIFRFRERARQDILLNITDVPNHLTTDFMESFFLFFPRRVVPAIQWPNDETSSTFTVVLPTEERVQFDTKTKEIVAGPLQEVGEVDLGPDRSKRKFAAIRYTGSGIYLRADAVGDDPRFANTATVFSAAHPPCRIPTRELFDQRDGTDGIFLFPTDEGFDAFLQKKCGFRLLP